MGSASSLFALIPWWFFAGSCAMMALFEGSAGSGAFRNEGADLSFREGPCMKRRLLRILICLLLAAWALPGAVPAETGQSTVIDAVFVQITPPAEGRTPDPSPTVSPAESCAVTGVRWQYRSKDMPGFEDMPADTAYSRPDLFHRPRLHLPLPDPGDRRRRLVRRCGDLGREGRAPGGAGYPGGPRGGLPPGRCGDVPVPDAGEINDRH